MTSPGDHSVGSTSFATGPKILPSFEFEQRVKRAFDILAATMCLMLFSPILLMTSIAIKLDSPGPIFVREALYGNGRPIRVLKFRLVTAYAESGHVKPSITRVGQILSQSGIDELPQLFNVLRGEISIVGRRSVPRWPASLL
jgi:lipopolysaccharide/colanic/teichoic acid biosynthesis glycosyltransferase